MRKFDEIISFLLESKVRVISSFVVTFIAILLCFCFSNDLIKLLESRIPYNDIQILQLYVHEVVFNGLKLGVFTGLFLSAPFLIYQFSKLKINSIGLESKNKLVKLTSYIFLTCVLGVLISYYWLIPFQLYILLGLNFDIATLTLNLSDYISFCIATILVTCIVFLMPLFYYFSKKKMFFNSNELVKARKPMIYTAFILSLIILAPPEILGFMFFALLLIVFYQLTIIVVKKSGN